MKVTSNFSVTEENFPDQSSWIGRLLSPLSTVIQNVISAINGNLRIGDNLVGVVYTSTVLTGTAYNTGTFTPVRIPWSPGSAKLPFTVFVGKCVVPSNQTAPLTAITAQNWVYDFSSNSVVINYIAGLANSSTYTLTFEVK